MFKQIIVVAALVACALAIPEPEANPAPVARPVAGPFAAPAPAANPAAHARPQYYAGYDGLGYGYGGLGYAAPVAYGGLYY